MLFGSEDKNLDFNNRKDGTKILNGAVFFVNEGDEELGYV